MNKLAAKIMSSKFVNSGIVKVCKDYVYDHFVSPHLEARTDRYRKEILADLWEILEGYDWILCAGSFLRFYRDHTMDGQDLDILIDFDDFQKVKKRFMERGYYVATAFMDENGRINEYKLQYQRATIDMIFVFHDEDGWYYIGTYRDPQHEDQVTQEVKDGKRIIGGDGYRAYRKNIPDFECSPYEFAGMKFMGYRNVDAHLTAEYGDWHTPDPHFVFLEGPKENPPQNVGKAQAICYYEPLREY